MESSEVVKIRVENIYPHPDNPRKDLGDVTELAESMKKHGVTQNLTVIPASALTADPEDQPDADKVSVISDFHAEEAGYPRLSTVTKPYIQKFLKEQDIKSFKIKYYCEKRDPDFESKMHEVFSTHFQRDTAISEYNAKRTV